MDGSDSLNTFALLVALVAVVSSSFLAWRALRLNANANHLVLTMELLKKQREADFVRKELSVWNELAAHDPDLGFTMLPEPMRGNAFEVALFYQSLSYVAEYGIVEWDFLAVQTEYRLRRTWRAVKEHAEGERVLRGGPNTFLNAFERFAENVGEADLEAATERLYRRRVR